MIDEMVPGTKRRLDGRRRILRETGAPAEAATERFAGIGTKQAGMEEEKEKNALGGPRKSLKRLDSDKEIQALALVGFGRAWLDLAKFG